MSRRVRHCRTRGIILATERGFVPDQRFETREAARAAACLVIKTYWQESRQPADPRGTVGFDATRGIDRSEAHAFLQKQYIAALVGLGPDLEQLVRIVCGSRVQAAAAVVLEAACRGHDAGPGQCRGQRIAGESPQRAAFESETQAVA